MGTLLKLMNIVLYQVFPESLSLGFTTHFNHHSLDRSIRGASERGMNPPDPRHRSAQTEDLRRGGGAVEGIFRAGNLVVSDFPYAL